MYMYAFVCLGWDQLYSYSLLYTCISMYMYTYARTYLGHLDDFSTAQTQFLVVSTVFMLSIHSVSTGPSNMNHFLSGALLDE